MIQSVCETLFKFREIGGDCELLGEDGDEDEDEDEEGSNLLLSGLIIK